jgi:glycosyltransferase involved in cell wall biosynthesis
VGDIGKTVPNYRLILVDDNSDPEGAAFIDALAKEKHDTLLIRSNYQRWFTRTVNLGLRMVRTPWACVLNTDTEYGPGWLDELLAVRDEAQAAMGRRVGLVGSVRYEKTLPRWMSTAPADYVTGHCWLLSMDALYEVSANRGTPGIYLNEQERKQIHIHSDNYLCWDLNRLNWATIKAFHAEVFHHDGKSWGHALGEALAVQIEDVSDHYV